MSKTKIILIVAILLTFAAGTSLGLLITRSGHGEQRRSWLTSELNLTAEQRDQMRKIWSDTMATVSRQHADRRSALAQERDQKVLALLSAEQRTQYDAVQQEYSRKVEELSAERKKAMDEAIARTKKILTSEQAAKYEELMRKQPDRGMGEGLGGFHGNRFRHSATASGPVTTQPSPPRGGD